MARHRHERHTHRRSRSVPKVIWGSHRIGFNDGVPITEQFYAEYISGKHNEDIAKFFFPDDHQRGLKFTDEKEAMFRRLAKDKLKPVKGLYKLKKWVEDRGLKRSAVTNAPRENAELMISDVMS
ncbi:hypothetical protein U1Q18_025206 [Sarracenia purpurea var. burkii]